jgi:HEAT repeat protein
MSSRRIATITLGFFLFGSITLLAAPTREEDDANRYTKMLKTSAKPADKINALKELARLGQISSSLTKTAQTDIIKALDDKDSKVRAEAAHTIGQIDPENKMEVVSKLIQMLKSEKDEPVREGAAMGLGAMGSDAKDAVSALREAKEKAGKKDGRIYQTALQSIIGKKK